MRLPTIETERLLVRELRPVDAEAVTQGIGGVGEGWLEWTIAGYAQYDGLRQPPYGERGVELRETGELVGIVGIVPSMGPFGLLPSLAGGPGDPARHRPEVGLFWATAPAHLSRGYASEAGAAVVDYGLRALQLDRMVATTTHDNAASIAVMRRIGMRVEENPRPDPPWFQVVGIAFAADRL